MSRITGNVSTLHNVSSVHREMFSTSGVFSLLGGCHEYIGGYVECIGGISLFMWGVS